MARCRRLDRSMPCFSSPLSRVASALLAFLNTQAHCHVSGLETEISSYPKPLALSVSYMLMTPSHSPQLRKRARHAYVSGHSDKVQDHCIHISVICILYRRDSSVWTYSDVAEKHHTRSGQLCRLAVLHLPGAQQGAPPEAP